MQGFITQGKKLKLEHETDDEDVGDVTDEDEAADIDQEAAAAVLQEKSAEGGDGPSTTAPTTTDTPPVKKKEKKPKKVLVEQVQGLTLNVSSLQCYRFPIRNGITKLAQSFDDSKLPFIFPK